MVRKNVQETSPEKATRSSKKLCESVTHWVNDDYRTSQQKISKQFATETLNTFPGRYSRQILFQLEGDWKRLNLNCDPGETYVKGQNKAWISPFLLFCCCSAAHVASM